MYLKESVMYLRGMNLRERIEHWKECPNGFGSESRAAVLVGEVAAALCEEIPVAVNSALRTLSLHGKMSNIASGLGTDEQHRQDAASYAASCGISWAEALVVITRHLEEQQPKLGLQVRPLGCEDRCALSSPVFDALSKEGRMHKYYFESQYKDDLRKLSYIFPDTTSFMYSRELARNMKFIDVSSIASIEAKHRQDFVFILFILMTLDQVCYTYFGLIGSTPLYGDFGMGQAANVRSPRDFLAHAINSGLIGHKVKKIKLECYARFMLNITQKRINERNINKNILQFYLYVFTDKDLTLLPKRYYEVNKGRRVYDRFMSALLGILN
jgi:hypothetical protein